MKAYYQYAHDVLSGKVVTGKFVKLSVKRFFSFMENDRYEFNEKKCERVISFISLLKHFTGKHAGNNFILEPWQQFIIANMYGFYIKESGERLTQSVYIEMARKNGKSAIAAALCLNHLMNDGEANAEVYLAANSKDQAKISFSMCSNFVKGLDPVRKYLNPFRDRINYDRALSFLRVLAADDSKLDGFNASMYLIDEYHAAKTTRIKDVLQSSQGMREHPMSIIITTAGFDKLGPCYQYRTMCTEVIAGLKEDDTLFSMIYSLDDEDDWKDENVWIKSNPNLNVTVKPSFIKKEIQKAINSPSDEVGIKTKNINVWCDSEQVWIPDHYILAASKDVSIDDFKDRECYIGIDLASTSDLTAMTALFPDEEKGEMYFKTFYYLPQAALKEKRFKELYGEWKRMKALTVTPGNVTDYDYILSDLIRLDKKVLISKIGYDQWNATQFIIKVQDEGFKAEAISQTIGNFNRPTKEFERLILSGKGIIDNNIINRHCLRNVMLKADYMGNTKPTKQYEEKKIDGVISQLTALSAYLTDPHYSASL
jgi:phage terminase large subunit-like protein